MSVGAVLGSVWQSSQAADWPQWRGSNRDGISTEKSLKSSWDSAPELEWVFRDAGKGYSGPSIVDGTYFSMGTEGDSEVVFAISTADGSLKWKTPVGDVLSNGWGDGPRSTPTVDGDFLYTMSGTGNLTCLKKDSGKKVWSVNMEKDLGGKVPTWGYTESVLVDNGHVLCTPGGSKGAIAALDAISGKVLWQTRGFDDEAQYSSIVKATIHGTAQYVQRTMTHVVGVDAASGKVLWKSDFPGRTAMIPTPVVKGNLVYITGGYGTGCKLIRISANWSAEEVYFNRDMKNHHGGVVLVDDAIFGYSDGVGWLMQDLESGKDIWSDKNQLGKGAVTVADGHFYCLSEDSGEVELLAISRNGYQSKGKFTISPQSEIRSSRGKVWTHPVIVDGKLYLRDQDLVYCYNIQK